MPENDRAITPPDGRDPECVERWPECIDGGYDPRCCRFPKSCSCGPVPDENTPSSSSHIPVPHSYRETK